MQSSWERTYTAMGTKNDGTEFMYHTYYPANTQGCQVILGTNIYQNGHKYTKLR
jgi:hypothetical protein